MGECIDNTDIGQKKSKVIIQPKLEGPKIDPRYTRMLGV